VEDLDDEDDVADRVAVIAALEKQEAVRQYMRGLPTLDQLATVPKAAPVPKALDGVMPVRMAQWLTQETRKAEKKWTRCHSMQGRSVPRVNRFADRDKTNELDAMNLAIAGTKVADAQHRVIGADGKVIRGLYGAGPGSRKLLAMTALGCLGCARGEVLLQDAAGEEHLGWSWPRSFCSLALLLSVLGCFVLFVGYRWRAAKWQACCASGVDEAMVASEASGLSEHVVGTTRLATEANDFDVEDCGEAPAQLCLAPNRCAAHRFWDRFCEEQRVRKSDQREVVSSCLCAGSVREDRVGAPLDVVDKEVLTEDVVSESEEVFEDEEVAEVAAELRCPVEKCW
jgi:hypothetical protein